LDFEESKRTCVVCGCELTEEEFEICEDCELDFYEEEQAIPY